MIPILALAAIRGGLQGARNVKQAKAEKEAKVEERAQEIADAQLKAQRDHQSKVLLEQEKARLRSLEEQQKKQLALRTTAMRGINFRTGLTDYPQMSIEHVADVTGYDKLDPNAVFRARVPVFDADGEQVYRDEDGGKPAFDVAEISLTKRDDPTAAITQFTSKFSKQTLDWWQNNQPARYDQAIGFLSGNVIQQAQDAGTSGIQGVSQGFPRVPSTTVNTLISSYGPEVAEKLIRDAMPTLGNSVRQYYEQEFNAVVAKDAEVTPTPVVDQTTGETVVVPKVEEGGIVEPSIDKGGKIDRQVQMDLDPIAKSTGKSIDKVKANFAIYGEATDRTARDVYTSVKETRGIIGGNQWWLYPSPQVGMLDAEDKQQFGKFWLQNELFSGLSPADSIDLVETLAGPGIQGFSYAPQDREGIVPAHKGGMPDQFVAQKKGNLQEKLESERSRVSGKYGYDVADVRNKGQAAKDALISVDALLYEYTQGASIPGAAGSAINTLVGAKEQVSYFIQAITTASDQDMDPKKKEKYLQDLRGLQNKLSVEGLDQVAVANRLREYQEGVLVYSMAMALQGGNAAARTISDADIERISQILAVGQSLGTTEQKVAVMRALKKELSRRSAIADAYASGKESKVWAASTVETYLAENEYGGQSVIDVLYKQFVNPNAPDRNQGVNQVAPERPMIRPAPNGRGSMYLQPNGTYGRQPHPEMQYPEQTAS